jgi:hypothetical protein
MKDSNFYECVGSLNGGVIFADSSSKISDYSSTYSLNSAINGGVFYIKDNSTLNLTKSKIL